MARPGCAEAWHGQARNDEAGTARLGRHGPASFCVAQQGKTRRMFGMAMQAGQRNARKGMASSVEVRPGIARQCRRSIEGQSYVRSGKSLFDADRNGKAGSARRMHGSVLRGQARLGSAWLGNAGKARRVLVRQSCSWQGSSLRCGASQGRHGKATRVPVDVRLSPARQGKAGTAMQGEACSGDVGPGNAETGMAMQAGRRTAKRDEAWLG